MKTLQSTASLRTVIYYLGIAALFTHELDAVLNMEWRLLYHLRTLPDSSASSLFIALHFPLFFTFFYFGHHGSTRIKTSFRIIVSMFIVIHSVLHFRLSNDVMYQFEGVLSSLYIYGAALFGLCFIALTCLHSKSYNNT